MGHFKTFILGITTAFVVYYITRKDKDGTSILDDILDHPSDFLGKAKKLAIAEVVKTVKDHL